MKIHKFCPSFAEELTSSKSSFTRRTPSSAMGVSLISAPVISTSSRLSVWPAREQERTNTLEFLVEPICAGRLVLHLAQLEPGVRSRLVFLHPAHQVLHDPLAMTVASKNKDPPSAWSPKRDPNILRWVVFPNTSRCGPNNNIFEATDLDTD